MPDKEITICRDGVFDEDGNRIGLVRSIRLDITAVPAECIATVEFVNPRMANYPPPGRPSIAITQANITAAQATIAAMMAMQASSTVTQSTPATPAPPTHRNLSAPDQSLTDASRGVM